MKSYKTAFLYYYYKKNNNNSFLLCLQHGISKNFEIHYERSEQCFDDTDFDIDSFFVMLSVASLDASKFLPVSSPRKSKINIGRV